MEQIRQERMVEDLMEHWDRREKVFDGNTPEDIIEDFELAKVMMDCFQHKKEHFLIGLDLISEGKRIDEQLDFWESKLGKLCRENYQLLKSKGKDVDQVMNFFSEKTKDKLK